MDPTSKRMSQKHQKQKLRKKPSSSEPTPCEKIIKAWFTPVQTTPTGREQNAATQNTTVSRKKKKPAKAMTKTAVLVTGSSSSQIVPRATSVTRTKNKAKKSFFSTSPILKKQTPMNQRKLTMDTNECKEIPSIKKGEELQTACMLNQLQPRQRQQQQQQQQQLQTKSADEDESGHDDEISNSSTISSCNNSYDNRGTTLKNVQIIWDGKESWTDRLVSDVGEGGNEENKDSETTLFFFEANDGRSEGTAAPDNSRGIIRLQNSLRFAIDLISIYASNCLRCHKSCVVCILSAKTKMMVGLSTFALTLDKANSWRLWPLLKEYREEVLPLAKSTNESGLCEEQNAKDDSNSALVESYLHQDETKDSKSSLQKIVKKSHFYECLDSFLPGSEVPRQAGTNITKTTKQYCACGSNQDCGATISVTSESDYEDEDRIEDVDVGASRPDDEAKSKFMLISTFIEACNLSWSKYSQRSNFCHSLDFFLLDADLNIQQNKTGSNIGAPDNEDRSAPYLKYHLPSFCTLFLTFVDNEKGGSQEKWIQQKKLEPFVYSNPTYPMITLGLEETNLVDVYIRAKWGQHLLDNTGEAKSTEQQNARKQHSLVDTFVNVCLASVRNEGVRFNDSDSFSVKSFQEMLMESYIFDYFSSSTAEGDQEFLESSVELKTENVDERRKVTTYFCDSRQELVLLWVFVVVNYKWVVQDILPLVWVIALFVAKWARRSILAEQKFREIGASIEARFGNLLGSGVRRRRAHHCCSINKFEFDPFLHKDGEFATTISYNHPSTDSLPAVFSELELAWNFATANSLILQALSATAWSRIIYMLSSRHFQMTLKQVLLLISRIALAIVVGCAQFVVRVVWPEYRHPKSTKGTTKCCSAPEDAILINPSPEDSDCSMSSTDSVHCRGLYDIEYSFSKHHRGRQDYAVKLKKNCLVSKWNRFAEMEAEGLSYAPPRYRTKAASKITGCSAPI